MAQTEDQSTADLDPQDAPGKTLSADEIQALAQQFGEALGEKHGQPVQQIILLIEKCGLQFVEKIMAETEATESAGGLLTQDSKRRRTKGGVFFYLAKGQMDPQYLTEVFPNLVKHGDGNIMPPGIEWADRLQHMQALRDNPGRINNLTVKLTGRPGALHIEGSSVMTVIEQQDVKAPPYPKGVPPFGSVDGRSTCYVFMGLRHWQKVEKALENEKDMLVIEGTVIYDPQLDGISILSTGVTTKILEQLKRQKQPGAKSGAHAAKAPVKGKRSRSPLVMTPPPDLSALPEETADKLRKLYDAADRLRLKLVAMQDKEQTSGVAMTRRLLEQTEKQITTLAKQYDL